MGIHNNVINFIDHVQDVHLGYSLVKPSLGHITCGILTWALHCSRSSQFIQPTLVGFTFSRSQQVVHARWFSSRAYRLLTCLPHF